MADYIIDVNNGTLTLTSLSKIVLQVGDNSITLDTSGITVQATNISQKAQLQASLNCVTATVSASGEYTNSSTLIKLG